MLSRCSICLTGYHCHSKMTLKVWILLLVSVFFSFFFFFFINLVSPPPPKEMQFNWKLQTVHSCENKCEYVCLYLGATLQGVKMCRSILKCWYVRSWCLLLTKKHQSIQVLFKKQFEHFVKLNAHLMLQTKSKKLTCCQLLSRREALSLLLLANQLLLHTVIVRDSDKMEWTRVPVLLWENRWYIFVFLLLILLMVVF